jgi:protein kinase-like protein
VSTSTQVQIGSDFLGYRIEELIGQGGMGVVYRAYDLRLKRTVALKLIVPELALDERFHARFARETELTMSLEHPNVVPVYDAGDADGRFYLAMRLVEGADLGALLRTEALDQARALAICSQVANALDAAHARGLVHRDVKPSNVLLDASEHVYLADFGLTRRLDEQGSSAGEGRSVGTPAYLAPEQIEGGSVDGRADVYSLGCLFYECLTGETPFSRGSRLAVAWAHLEEEPPSARERRLELPEAIDAVICKAMAKEPENRYPTCTGLITAAEDALGIRRPPTVRLHRLLVVAAVATLLLLAALLVAVVVLRDAGGGGTAPAVAPDTLVRIDPATYQVDAVVDVGASPAATAVGGRTVWVYNEAGPSVTEIDAASGGVRHTTKLVAVPRHPTAFEGPVLAADTAGAWVIGVDQRARSHLTRVFSGPRRKREYPLEDVPHAVAVGYRVVWVATRGARSNHVLGIDPATGEVTKRTSFPNSSPIDGLTVGLGNVWVVASSTGMLYRIDPRSARITGRVDLVGHAARPVVVLGAIWVGLSESGGSTVTVAPRSLNVAYLECCPPEWGYFTAGHGSIWQNDMPTGNVVRWGGYTHDSDSVVHVTDPPLYKGLCLTSIAAGAGAIWVTLAENNNYHC